MKGSIVTSAIMHATLLAAALVTLGAPKPLDVGDSESLPVDLVSIEELTQIQQGDKSAPKAEKAAPVPTTKPNPVENAQEVGDNNVDMKAAPTPAEKPVEIEANAPPKPSEVPLPQNDSKPNDVKDIVKEETAPPEEVAALPQPKEETPPEPTPEPPKPEAEALPDNVPLPTVKPKPPEKPAEKPPEQKTEQAKAAEKPSDAKKADKKQETAKASSSKETDFNADEVAALLNKQKPSGGGAKRSTDQAALGGKKTTVGNTLSLSEMDGLKGQIQKNWSIIAGIEGAEGVIVTVTMKLDQNGGIIGRPEVKASGGSESARRTLEGSALRAVMRSQPFTNLPPDKYDSWSDVVVNFDTSSMNL